MNRVMRVLAVVSVLGLIPAVVGGLFGINLIDNPWPFTLRQVAFFVVYGTVLCLYVFLVKGWLLSPVTHNLLVSICCDASAEDIRALYQMGADCCIQKPVSAVKLEHLFHHYPNHWQFSTDRGSTNSAGGEQATPV